MPELQLLRADHAAAVLAFETENRAYFARSVSDRGEDYFEHFADVHHARLSEQEAGLGAYYVLIDDDGSVLGRFNLIIVDDDAAELGYRLAERVAGRGVATARVGEICAIAATRHGLRVLRAATAHANVASRRVLLKNGFRRVGSADPADVGGKAGAWYERDLAPEVTG